MTSAESGKHRLQRRLLSEGEPGDLARWDAEASRLGLTWAGWVRALQNESVSMPEVIIYGIRAVGTDQIRFVGATALRLTERRKEGYPGRLGEWLAGVEWEYVELERTTVARATESEARWVAQLGGEGLLFNAGTRPAELGGVCVPVELSRATHASAVDIAAAGHWSLGAFVQLAVEQLVERMKRGERVEVSAPGVVKDEPNCEIIYWCSICGNVQRKTPSGLRCSNDHGGADSTRSMVKAAGLRAVYAMRRLPDDEDEEVNSELSHMPVASEPAPRPHGPRGSASNPNSAFGRGRDDDADIEDKASLA